MAVRKSVAEDRWERERNGEREREMDTCIHSYIYGYYKKNHFS